MERRPPCPSTGLCRGFPITESPGRAGPPGALSDATRKASSISREKRSERRPRGLGPGTSAAQCTHPPAKLHHASKAGSGQTDAAWLLFHVRDTSPRGPPRGLAPPSLPDAPEAADAGGPLRSSFRIGHSGGKKRGEVPPPTPAADDESLLLARQTSRRDRRGRRPRQATLPAPRNPFRACEKAPPTMPTGHRLSPAARRSAFPPEKPGERQTARKKKARQRASHGPVLPTGAAGPGGGARHAPLTPPPQLPTISLGTPFLSLSLSPFSRSWARAPSCRASPVVPRRLKAAREKKKKNHKRRPGRAPPQLQPHKPAHTPGKQRTFSQPSPPATTAAGTGQTPRAAPASWLSRRRP